MAFATNGDTQIFYETFGDNTKPALVLINGLGSQCINYQDAWCEMFASAGFNVVRMDNRDVGLSSFSTAPYSLSDMANDVVAVLDALNKERAHVMGLSMGGMIVQTLAIEHPDRLRSMTSIMSTSGEPEYGQSSPRALELLLAPAANDREGRIAQWIEGLREWGSPEFADEVRWRSDVERSLDRSDRPEGSAKQFAAVRSSPSRAEKLRDVKVPTLVMHGDRDTLIDASGGRRVAELIPGARFELIVGMGHDYPPQIWPRWTEMVTTFCANVDAGHA